MKPPSLEERVAVALADGRFHSGQVLAEAFGVTRAAVWKAVRALTDKGMDVHAVAGKGYRLPRPVDWLDADRLGAALDAGVRSRIESLRIERITDSTNARLLATPPPAAGCAQVCMAEFQSAGRGRLGREWRSPPGSGLCLSVAWRFDLPPQRLSALSLSAGVAIAEALAGRDWGLGLKWPNDLIWNGRKLGGILTELAGEAGGPTHAVLGVGLNLALPAGGPSLPLAEGALEPVDLETAAGCDPRQRNVLAARVLEGLVRAFLRFEADGFGPFAEHWRAYDVLHGEEVIVTRGQRADRVAAGIARGIDFSGALLLDGPEGLERVFAGDVRTRPAP